MIEADFISIEVPAARMPAGRGHVVISVFAPDVPPARPTVIFALPGGGYSRGYFDLQFPGRHDYSQAAHHVERGFILIAMDHLGVGASSTEANDQLRIEDIADANHAAVDEVLARLRAGTLAPDLPAITAGFVVGTGQSMGGGVTIIMQGRHRTYDAIASMGYGVVHASLPQRSPELRELGKAIFDKFSRSTPNEELSVPHTSERMPDFMYPFHWEDVPQDILDADLAGGYPLRQHPPRWGSATIPRCVVGMMAPGYAAEEAAAVDVPVFLGYGERDVAEHPWREPSMFPASRDVTVYTVPRMAHMHNFASTRRMLWDRSVDWMHGVRAAAERDQT